MEVVKRTNLVRIVPPPIKLVDWDEIEGNPPQRAGIPAHPGMAAVQVCLIDRHPKTRQFQGLRSR